MSPASSRLAIAKGALCALLLAQEQVAAFVAPSSSFVATRQQATTSSAVRSTGAMLKMVEEVEGEAAPAGPTAEEISKGIAHPEAVFTVPENILKVLPHRYPFALVDKVLHFEPGKRIVGVKCITNNEPQFTGHFPDLPIMPGVLQVCGFLKHAWLFLFTCVQRKVVSSTTSKGFLVPASLHVLHET